MSRAVLFCNGALQDNDYHRALIKKDDLIIAVDGGGVHCKKLGLSPDIALGDFDSLPQNLKADFEKNQTELIPYPTDKNYIDMVLAIEIARQRGYRDILILGALGGRRHDMFFGNIMALSAFDENVVIKDELSEIRYLKHGVMLDLFADIGDYLSILPLSDMIETEDSNHLKYRLNGLILHRGETRGISNEFIKNQASLSLKKGEAVIIVQKR